MPVEFFIRLINKQMYVVFEDVLRQCLRVARLSCGYLLLVTLMTRQGSMKARMQTNWRSVYIDIPFTKIMSTTNDVNITHVSNTCKGKREWRQYHTRVEHLHRKMGTTLISHTCRTPAQENGNDVNITHVSNTCIGKTEMTSISHSRRTPAQVKWKRRQYNKMSIWKRRHYTANVKYVLMDL